MLRLCAALMLSAMTACTDGTNPDVPAVYLIDVLGEQFHVRVETEAQVERLEARRQAGTTGVIIGSLKAGDGGFNQPWSWHLDPATVDTPDFAIEVCDGRPSDVQRDLDQWIINVKSFCPWSARVVRQVR